LVIRTKLKSSFTKFIGGGSMPLFEFLRTMLILALIIRNAILIIAFLTNKE